MGGKICILEKWKRGIRSKFENGKWMWKIFSHNI